MVEEEEQDQITSIQASLDYQGGLRVAEDFAKALMLGADAIAVLDSWDCGKLALSTGCRILCEAVTQFSQSNK